MLAPRTTAAAAVLVDSPMSDDGSTLWISDRNSPDPRTPMVAATSAGTWRLRMRRSYSYRHPTRDAESPDAAEDDTNGERYSKPLAFANETSKPCLLPGEVRSYPITTTGPEPSQLTGDASTGGPERAISLRENSSSPEDTVHDGCVWALAGALANTVEIAAIMIRLRIVDSGVWPLSKRGAAVK